MEFSAQFTGASSIYFDHGCQCTCGHIRLDGQHIHRHEYLPQRQTYTGIDCPGQYPEQFSAFSASELPVRIPIDFSVIPAVGALHLPLPHFIDKIFSAGSFIGEAPSEFFQNFVLHNGVG